MAIKYLTKKGADLLYRRLMFYKNHLKAEDWDPEGDFGDYNSRHEYTIGTYGESKHTNTAQEIATVEDKLLTETQLKYIISNLVEDLGIRSTIYIGIPTFAATASAATYTGTTVTINPYTFLNNYNADAVSIKGTLSASSAGTYSFTLTPNTGYQWPDGSSTPKTFKWTIDRASLPNPSISTSLTYTGEEQDISASIVYTDAEGEVTTLKDANVVSMSGLAGTNAGEYTAKLKIVNSNYQWADGTISEKSIAWKINRAEIPQPSAATTFTYSGSEQTATWDNYSAEKITISGAYSATAAGTYEAKFTPTENYAWTGGETGTVSKQWTINKLKLTIPTVSANRTYNGSAQSPGLSNYNSTWENVSGNSQTNAGTYTATFSLKDTTNTLWSDNTTSNKTASWTIGRLAISTADPTISANRTYNGSAQSPGYSNYNSTYMTLGGTTSATNAGSYNVTFTLKSNYAWKNGSTGVITRTWSIGKLSVTKPTINANRTYNGNTQSPGVSNYNSTYMNQGGTTSATNAGSYTITYSLKNTTNTQWSGGGTGTVSLSWSISAATPHYSKPQGALLQFNGVQGKKIQFTGSLQPNYINWSKDLMYVFFNTGATTLRSVLEGYNGSSTVRTARRYDTTITIDWTGSNPTATCRIIVYSYNTVQATWSQINNADITFSFSNSTASKTGNYANSRAPYTYGISVSTSTGQMNLVLGNNNTSSAAWYSITNLTEKVL